MAEPAHQLDSDPLYGEPGTAPSDPRPDLKALEGGGETSTPKTGHLSEVGAEEPSREGLSEAENSPAEAHPSTVGKGYTGPGSSIGRFSIRGFNRRRVVFGGGALGTIVAILMFFTFLSGPFEFIHIAQLMEKFHFSTLQNQQDDRFWRMSRFVRYYQSGAVEKTRMGFLGNKFADRYETKLNATGFKSSYTSRFGLFNGYVIDRENPNFKGKSDSEIKQFVKENYDLDVVDGQSLNAKLNGELVIDGRNMNYTKSYRLSYDMLRQSGRGRLSSAIGARMFCSRAGCDFHVLKKLSGNNIKLALENWLDGRNRTIKEGQNAITAKDSPNDPKKPDADKETAAGSVDETNKGAIESAKDKTKFADFKGSTGAKLLGGGAAAIGVLCMVKGVHDNAGEIKQTQVILPLIRMGMETMAVGSQVYSGKDVDLKEMAQLSKNLHGVDSSGNKSSWVDGESIQGELGNNKTGIAPSDTLTTIGKGAPFGFVERAPLGAILGATCSLAGGILIGGLTLGLSLTGVGAAATQLALAGGGALITPTFIDQIAHWLAGNAVDPEAVGADYGNQINYGAKLAANDQAITAGGRQLSDTETYVLKSFSDKADSEQFNSQSVARRLFSPYDGRSAVSKIIDKTSPSLSQNMASLASTVFNIGHIFSAVPKIFSGSATAAAGFDYGFSTYGFSQAEMESATANEIPYQNADEVADILVKNPSYIKNAQDCFNVKLVRVPDDKGNMLWDVQPGVEEAPDFLKLDKSCASASDPNWLKIRFFIMDTEGMNSMSCFEGDDQACADIGFDSNSAATQTAGPTGSATGSLPSGSAQDLAAQLMQYVDNGKVKCATSGCPDIANTASGKSIKGAGCNVDSLDPKLVGMLLEAAQMGHTFILSAVCSDHPSNPDSLHHQGKAADFNTIDAVYMGPNDTLWTQAKVNAASKLDRDIASFMPKGTGFGQIQCHPAFDFLAEFVTFQDTCHHQHIQVGG